MKKGKNLAIIGASYLQMPLIKKAREMGYVTHVFAWKANDPGETEADYFYPISIVEKEKIAEVCRSLKIDGICTIASDLAAVTVNYVADQLGLPGNSMECTELSTNKAAMREAFRLNNDPSCISRKILPEDHVLEKMEEGFKWPLIVKPSDRSGSRGIFLVNSPQELKKAVDEAREQSFNKVVLVEDYIPGDEYSIEYISQNGNHHFLAATRKETTGAPHFIETGHIEPSGLSDEMLNNVCKVVVHALNTLKITTGASHSEIRIHNDDIRIIEIGGRMGGDCIGSHLVPLSTGYDYVGMVIDCAVGNQINLVRKTEPVSVGIRFITNEESYEKFKSLMKKSPEIILEVPDMNPENLNQMTDSSNRAGCYIYQRNKQ